MTHGQKEKKENWNQNKGSSKYWIYHTENLQKKKKVYDKYVKGSKRYHGQYVWKDEGFY